MSDLDGRPETITIDLGGIDEPIELAYLFTLPAAVPEGRCLVHNHVRPMYPDQLGLNGFRAWLAEPRPLWEICECDWAPELGTHYRVHRIGDVGAAESGS
jgi:hypothetical protein